MLTSVPRESEFIVQVKLLVLRKIIWFITLIAFKPIHQRSNNFSSDLQTGLPFARLKLKPVQRMSLLLDYEVMAGPERERERINKRQSRAGLALGGKCQASAGSQAGQRNNLGQCFLCQEPATIKVTKHHTQLYILWYCHVNLMCEASWSLFMKSLSLRLKAETAAER